jgi:uncharacterized protein YcaQ
MPDVVSRRAPHVETISLLEARRLALARAGLLKPEWTGFPDHAPGRDAPARSAAHRVIGRFGYLQLDTVSVAGARSHALVLLSRLRGLDHRLAEDLLRPGEPLFEYWGHEACWMPLDLYPLFEFRRRRFREHPWWGDVIGRNKVLARNLMTRIREEGPLRSADMDGTNHGGWWDFKIAKQVATALWSRGDLAILERRSFRRSYDLAERVIPEALRSRPAALPEALERLLLLALDGHGWAPAGTLAATWRLRNLKHEIDGALARLVERGEIVRCRLAGGDGAKSAGYIRPGDLDLAARLRLARPRGGQGVLLSPFDPVLWDRARVHRLFDFDHRLEIFKPAGQRRWGYFCLPVLAGDRLVARCDLKADRRAGRLAILAQHHEARGRPPAGERAAVRTAIERYASAVELKTGTV